MTAPLAAALLALLFVSVGPGDALAAEKAGSKSGSDCERQQPPRSQPKQRPDPRAGVSPADKQALDSAHTRTLLDNLNVNRSRGGAPR